MKQRHRKRYPRPWLRDALRLALTRNLDARGLVMSPAGLAGDVMRILHKLEK